MLFRCVFAVCNCFVAQLFARGWRAGVVAIRFLTYMQMHVIGCVKQCVVHFKIYSIRIHRTTQTTHQAEKQWARSRSRLTAKRQTDVVNGTDAWGDAPDSFLACLTPAERERADEYNRSRPGVLGDVNQDPSEWPMRSGRDHLNTIIKNVGLLFSWSHSRWLLPMELLTAMGFPIADEHVQAAGAPCVFSRCKNAPETRSHRSMSNACGNAIHVNVIGAILMIAMLFFPKACSDFSPAVSHMSDLGATISTVRRLKRKRSEPPAPPRP